VEARSLTTLVATVLPRAWRRDSEWHGEGHWRCVAATGLSLASVSGRVDRTLVFCFALLHDTRRENEAVDPKHGVRAAAFAGELRAEGVLPLAEPRFGSLVEALRLHSDGQVTDDPTIGTCWDADRLHLPRVFIEPNPALFSTSAALGAAPLSAAEALREDGPPDWDALVALVDAAVSDWSDSSHFRNEVGTDT
jgi:uncharacterized protein